MYNFFDYQFIYYLVFFQLIGKFSLAQIFIFP